MNAVDTNILVRFLVGDDKKQAQIVYKLFKNAETKNEELFVPLVVVLELIWVLESAYSIKRDEIINAIADLLTMPILSFEHGEALQRFIIAAPKSNYDLSNLLIAHSAKNSGCKASYTFDKKAAKYELFELITE